MKLSWLVFAGGLIALISFQACEQQTFDTNSSSQLSFSKDTIRFDTVFTFIGSATRSVKVYNQSDDWIKISNITLGTSGSDRFRINVDGISGSSFENVEIPPNDSIWVFTEVTIDPDQPVSESPFVISEKIFFNTNGNAQSVDLEAWGQNANYVPNNTNDGAFALLTCDLQEFAFDDPKPYVIYGVLIVDSCELVLPAGTEVYVHGGLVNSQTNGRYNDGQLIFLNKGSIRSEGTIDNPVVFQGDRLESVFNDIDGQWTGIRFLEGSSNNTLDHTIIKNSILGIQADSAAVIDLKNTQIFNTTGAGISASHATITAENCLFFDNYGGGIKLGYGGNYDFKYCSIGSYGIQAPSLEMNNIRCLDQFCTTFRQNALTARFTNCIIAGSSDDEMTFLDIENGDDPTQFDYQFENCIVKVDELPTEVAYDDFDDRCVGCIKMSNMDPLFVNVDSLNYRLVEMSIAIGQAQPISGITVDLANNVRDASTPDIGCYEFQ
jgi:hypothetical protein